jgi:integrase
VKREADFRPKGARRRIIHLPAAVYARIMSFKPAAGEHVIEGSPAERLEYLPNRVSELLRCLGLEMDKPLHELRKWFGSYIAAEFGLGRAQKYLGHVSSQTTLDYYADLVIPEGLRSFWQGYPA